MSDNPMSCYKRVQLNVKVVFPPSRVMTLMSMPPIHLQPQRHERAKAPNTHENRPPKCRHKLSYHQIPPHRPVSEEAITKTPNPKQLTKSSRRKGLRNHPRAHRLQLRMFRVRLLRIPDDRLLF